MDTTEQFPLFIDISSCDIYIIYNSGTAAIKSPRFETFSFYYFLTNVFNYLVNSLSRINFSIAAVFFYLKSTKADLFLSPENSRLYTGDSFFKMQNMKLHNLIFTFVNPDTPVQRCWLHYIRLNALDICFVNTTKQYPFFIDISPLDIYLILCIDTVEIKSPRFYSFDLYKFLQTHSFFVKFTFTKTNVFSSTVSFYLKSTKVDLFLSPENLCLYTGDSFSKMQNMKRHNLIFTFVNPDTPVQRCWLHYIRLNALDICFVNTTKQYPFFIDISPFDIYLIINNDTAPVKSPQFDIPHVLTNAQKLLHKKLISSINKNNFNTAVPFYFETTKGCSFLIFENFDLSKGLSFYGSGNFLFRVVIFTFNNTNKLFIAYDDNKNELNNYNTVSGHYRNRAGNFRHTFVIPAKGKRTLWYSLWATTKLCPQYKAYARDIPETYVRFAIQNSDAPKAVCKKYGTVSGYSGKYQCKSLYGEGILPEPNICFNNYYANINRNVPNVLHKCS
ncbi:MAG: hypothetical protein LBD59_07725 [Prevotellaceae bacterium]|nr:hypothetical protein [Prevotellaceae bacterium]